MLISTVLSEQKPQLVLIPLSIALLAVAPAYVSSRMLISLITFLMYATLTLSWTMFSAPTNHISLVTAGLFGVGVYTSAVLRGSVPIELIVIAGGLIAFAVALAIGLLTLRLRGVYFILFTFGVTALIRNMVQWWETHITGTVGRSVAGATNETVYLLAMIIFSVTLIGLFLLRNSSFGLALQGIGDNQDAAEHLGVDVTRVKVLVFASSAFLMGAMGAVMATRWRYVDPSIAFNPLHSFLPVVMAIFGGTARLYGPIVGTLALFFLRDYLITEHPYVYMLIFGVILVVVVLWLPGGLVSQIEKAIFRVKVWWIKTRMWISRQRRLIGVRRAQR